MKSASQKIGVNLLIFIALYTVLSGPTGGVICYFAFRPGGAQQGFWGAAYTWHTALYTPLLLLADKLGLSEPLYAYWLFCGWLFPAINDPPMA